MAETYSLDMDQLGLEPHAGEYLLAGFDALRLEDRFGTPADAADYFRTTPFDEADGLFAEINRSALGPDAPAVLIDHSRHNYVIYGDMATQRTGGIANDDIAYIPADPVAAAESMEHVYDTASRLEGADDAGLLLRMGIFLTHRFANGNSRTAAIVESLGTQGYDGSEAYRLHYTTLAQGGRGIEKLGLTIDTEPVQSTYAGTILDRTIQHQAYAGPLPSDVTAFDINELAASRLDLPYGTARWAGRIMAERFFGLTLVVQHSLMNDRLADHLTKDDVGDVVVDSPAFFDDLDEGDISTLYMLHDATKVNFLNEISRAFVEGSDILGTAQDVRQSVYGR